MSRHLRAVVLSVCVIVSIALPTKSQGQSATSIQGIVLEMSIIEMTGALADAVENLEKPKEQLGRLMNEGKARLITNLQVRTRPGESFKARVGQRVPIQTGTLPVFRANDRMREPGQSQTASVGVPQIAYENTGLIVEGTLTATSDGLVDIKLNLEVSGLDRSTGSLTPTFTQRTLAGVVRMKISDAAVLMGSTQPEPPSLSDIASGTSATRLSRRSFIVLLTTKPVR
jgi:general secretion pathway protein D